MEKFKSSVRTGYKSAFSGRKKPANMKLIFAYEAFLNPT
jgi:hypothetical protein